MFKKWIFGALLAGAAAGCIASEPTDASIDELLEVTHAQRLVVSLQASVEGEIQKQVAKLGEDKTLTDRQRAALATIPGEVGKIFAEEMSWAKWRPTYVKIYKETFQEEDVRGLIAFYKSPTGKVAIEKLPIVLQKSMEAMQGSVAPITKRIQAKVLEIMRQAGEPAAPGAL